MFEIIVLGGGVVGLSAAHLLAKEGFRIALIEPHPPNLEWQEAFDSRCVAIAKSSQKIFEDIGVWQAMLAERISPYRQMHVWDALGFGKVTFDAAEIAEAELGHIIEQRVMIKALWQSIKRYSNVTLITPAYPKSIEIGSDHVNFALEDREVLQAKLVVGAEGANSWLRKTQAFKTVEHHYDQEALVATVETLLPHQETAWQRFLKEGPLAFLPLSDPHKSSIVWTASTEKIKTLMELRDEEFYEQLAHAFDYQLGKILSSSPRKCFTLKRLHAERYVQERMVLIGDAAHVIHPLAGQGVNLGLGDVAKLGEILSYANNTGYDIGHYLVLRKYERARKGQVKAMMAAMELLKEGFGSQSSLVMILRSIGLNFVDKNKGLKKKLILQATGTGSLL